MRNYSAKEWVPSVLGALVFVCGATAAGVLHVAEVLAPWAGWVLAVVAIGGLVTFAATVVRSIATRDTEGVELQDGSRAALLAVLVVVVCGMAYSVLEAFAGLPRQTGAVYAVIAGLAWMISFAWWRTRGEKA